MTTVLELLQTYSPNRPYCTNDLRLGVQIRGRPQALQCAYIQLNPPAFRYWLICDVDRAGAAFAAQDAGLPDPSWVAITRENRHAHLMWALETPVLLAENGSKTAMRYLRALEACYSDLVGADVGYSGLITKNPTSALWLHLNGPSTPIRCYTLDELADYVDLSAYRRPSQKSQERYSLGRNCTLFDWLRKWAYKAIRDHRGTERPNNYVVWQAQCYSKALERNGEFSYPLDPKEVAHIAKSVARYCWMHDSDAEAAFRARQAEKRRKGGLVGAGGRPRTTTANGKPWEEAGVSRRTWYRQRGTK